MQYHLSLDGLVLQGPKEPTFHDENNLYPIGFKAEFVDLETGIVFQNEILDGMDAFSEDVPAFQVHLSYTESFILIHP